ncbi:MAG: hypothetical protein QCH96_07715, partial [Candidatus Thermoplasmatota archaeon]|nr:hypothetical protein [Candidatus Thermoplasmatota archaeon]
VSSYNETPDDAMAQIKHPPKQKRTDVSKSSLLSKEDTITPVNETTEKSHNTSSEKKGFSKLFKKNFTMKKEV